VRSVHSFGRRAGQFVKSVSKLVKSAGTFVIRAGTLVKWLNTFVKSVGTFVISLRRNFFNPWVIPIIQVTAKIFFLY